MTTTVAVGKSVNQIELEQKVKEMYEQVARDPFGEFHFELGRAVAERLGYPSADLDRIPRYILRQRKIWRSSHLIMPFSGRMCAYWSPCCSSKTASWRSPVMTSTSGTMPACAPRITAQSNS